MRAPTHFFVMQSKMLSNPQNFPASSHILLSLFVQFCHFCFCLDLWWRCHLLFTSAVSTGSEKTAPALAVNIYQPQDSLLLHSPERCSFSSSLYTRLLPSLWMKCHPVWLQTGVITDGLIADSPLKNSCAFGRYVPSCWGASHVCCTLVSSLWIQVHVLSSKLWTLATYLPYFPYLFPEYCIHLDNWIPLHYQLFFPQLLLFAMI